MTSTGWMHFGILFLAFAGIILFFLRRTIFPAPKEGSEISGRESWFGSSGYEGHSGHPHDGGHGGHGGGDG
jgi:hypothetical protein